MLLAKAKGKGLPRLQKVLADDGYSGQPMIDHVRKEHHWEFERVKRTELHKFVVLPRRWVVERTIGWMNNWRALSKDYDMDLKSGESNILWAAIYYSSRRLTEPPVVKEPWICKRHEQKLAHLAKNATQIT